MSRPWSALIVSAALCASTARAEEPERCAIKSLHLPAVVQAGEPLLAQVEDLCARSGEAPPPICAHLFSPDLAALTAGDLDQLRAWLVDRKALRTDRHRDITGLLPLPALGNGGSDVVRGFGEFLTERAKAEAASFVEDEMVQRVCGREDIRCAFPHLCRLLEKGELRIGLAGMAQALRKAGELDLRGLPDYVLQRAAQGKSGAERAAVVALRMAWALVMEAQRGRSMLASAAALLELPDAELCGGDCPPELAAVQMAAAFAASLGRLDGLDLDPSPDRLAAAAALAAIAMEPGLKARGGAWAGLALEPAMLRQLPALATRLMPAAALARGPQATARDPLSQAQGEGSSRPADPRASLLAATAFARGLVTGAGVVLPMVPSSVCNPACRESTQRMLLRAVQGLEALELLGEGDGAGALWAVSSMVHDLGLDPQQVLPPDALRAGALVVELAKAESSAGVVSALEAAATPVGGYKTKYQRRVFAINAFVGAHAGGELLLSNPTLAAGTVAAFAPVGFHASWPVGQQHLGLFASVVDLGALTSHRLSSEASGATAVSPGPDVKLAQVFSPGLCFVWGLFGTPLVLGAGLSLTPMAREVTETAAGTTLTEKPIAFRAGAFAAVDVTIIPF